MHACAYREAYKASEGDREERQQPWEESNGRYTVQEASVLHDMSKGTRAIAIAVVIVVERERERESYSLDPKLHKL